MAKIYLNPEQMKDQCVDASELELPPGDWPKTLVVNDTLVLTFNGVDRTGTFAVYTSLAFTLTIFNT